MADEASRVAVTCRGRMDPWIVYRTMSQRADTGKIPVTLDRPPGAPRVGAGVDFGMVLHMMRMVRRPLLVLAAGGAGAGAGAGEQHLGRWQVSTATAHTGRPASTQAGRLDETSQGGESARVCPLAAGGGGRGVVLEEDRAWAGVHHVLPLPTPRRLRPTASDRGAGRMGSHAETVRKRWRAAGEGAAGALLVRCWCCCWCCWRRPHLRGP